MEDVWFQVVYTIKFGKVSWWPWVMKPWGNPSVLRDSSWPIENPLSAVKRNPWKWMGTLCSEVLYLWRMKENRTVLTVWSLKPLWNNNMFSSIFLPEHWHLSDQLGRLDYIVWKNSSRGFWWIAPPAMQSLAENYGSKGTANSEHRDSLCISHFPDLREKWIWKWMSPGRECKSNLSFPLSMLKFMCLFNCHLYLRAVPYLPYISVCCGFTKYRATEKIFCSSFIPIISKPPILQLQRE